MKWVGVLVRYGGYELSWGWGPVWKNPQTTPKCSKSRYACLIDVLYVLLCIYVAKLPFTYRRAIYKTGKHVMPSIIHLLVLYTWNRMSNGWLKIEYLKSLFWIIVSHNLNRSSTIHSLFCLLLWAPNLMKLILCDTNELKWCLQMA